jgi:hypothetical protein
MYAHTPFDVPEEEVRAMCIEMIEQLQKELRKAADLQAAVRHSDAFRNTYHPHYRIIRQ